jgi:hypothetical protein
MMEASTVTVDPIPSTLRMKEDSTTQVDSNTNREYLINFIPSGATLDTNPRLAKRKIKVRSRVPLALPIIGNGSQSVTEVRQVERSKISSHAKLP